MPNQTTVQNANAIFPFDGYKIEIGPNEGSLQNIGACDGDAVAELSWTKFKQESANAGVLVDQIKQMVANLTFSMFELDPTVLNQIGGGVFNLTTTAGAPVAGALQTVNSGEWVYDKLIPLTNKNSDGSQPTINSVTGSVDGPLTLNDDYFIAKNQDGKWSIYIVASGTLTTTEVQNITIDSDHTPAASYTLDAGTSSVTLTPQVVRFSHVNSGGKTRSLTIYAAALGDTGFTFTFGSAINDGVQSFPVSLQGDLDTSRDDGKQLLSYLDEQSAV
jgi:hypothetical protein